MILKKVLLKNFQCYEKFEASFSNMTFIRGRNGSGKTSLGLDAVLFGLYGYSKKNLSELPKRDKAKSCSVELFLEHNGENYRIVRSYPTALSIYKEEEPLKFSTKLEAQRYLEDIFKDAKYFQQFRMIDNDVGINFLEQGPMTLKKILFTASDQVFNTVKQKLQKVKQEREILNKDKAVVYSHAPSEKRLKILVDSIKNSKIKESEYLNIIRKLESERIQLERQISDILGKQKYFDSQIKKTKNQGICYACKRGVDDKLKQKIIDDLENKIAEQEEKEVELQPLLEEQKEIIELKTDEKDSISKRVSHFNDLKLKLEGRLKQKEYIYTQKDIEIVKKAIKELDNLSTRYLVRSVKILEPIINSVLEKINFSVSFDVNEKGKFNIILEKDEIKYSYKDLSAGQRILMQIAFKLALLLEKQEEGLIIADEGLSSLDSENLMHVLTIFENYPFQLVMVLHHFSDIPSEIKVIDLDKVREK